MSLKATWFTHCRVSEFKNATIMKVRLSMHELAEQYSQAHPNLYKRYKEKTITRIRKAPINSNVTNKHIFGISPVTYLIKGFRDLNIIPL